MDNGRYYIGTGAKECFYTLRYTFREQRARQTPMGVDYSVIERDYHVCNLSTDRDTAIAKAQAKTGKGLEASFDLVPITRRQDIDWSILQGGKYIGKSIHEVRETDPNYLLWLCGQNCDRKRYSKTIELLRVLMAQELAEKKAQDEAVAQEKARKAQEIADKAKPLIEILKNQRGEFAQSIAQDLEAGQLPRGRAIPITIDIYAKAFGRRNSKAYQEAHNQAQELLQEVAA